MQSVDPRHEEVGREVLERMRLLERACDPRSVWRKQLPPMLGGMGALLMFFQVMEIVPSSLMFFGGLVLAWYGFLLSRPSRAERRLDALVELLERTGHLRPVDEKTRVEPAA